MIIHPEDRLIVARQQQELLRSEAGPLAPALIVRLMGAARRATERGAAAQAAGPGARLRGSGVRRRSAPPGTSPEPEAAPSSARAGHAVVSDDSLTGADVDESTLGPVPSALLGGLGRAGSVGSCDPRDGRFVPGTETSTLVGITPPLGPGSVSFGVDCNQEGASSISYDEAQVTAVAIAPS